MPLKILDFHVHVTDNATGVEESIRYFSDYCSQRGFVGVCIHAAEYTSSRGGHPDCNEKALAVSRAIPNSYAFAGLHHVRDFVEQTKEYMERGFRGIKLLEGKPSCYRHYGYGFDHPRFQAFFAYAEEQGIPLLIHNNDPLDNWDISKVSESAFQKGWYYDASMPSQEDFFRVLEEDVLAKHPKLRAAIAHFGFYSNNLERAESLMERFPNLIMDMTPALCIFDELSETPERTRAFLEKYQDRIIYGTDVSNRIEGSVRTLNEKKVAVMQAFYEGTEIVRVADRTIAGMGLSEEILEKLYYNNAMRFLGVQL